MPKRDKLAIIVTFGVLNVNFVRIARGSRGFLDVNLRIINNVKSPLLDHFWTFS